MKIIRNIIDIWFNEFRTVFSDRGILIFILFVPIAYPLLYSYIYTNEVVRDVPAAIVNDCHSPLSRKFVRRVDGHPNVRAAYYCDDMRSAEELLKRQKVYGIIRIPKSFSEDIYRGDQTYVGVYCDMSSMLYYKALVLATTDVSLAMNKDIKVERYLPGTTDEQEAITRTPITFQYVPLYNPQSGFASFLIPPVLMLIIQQTLFLGIGMTMGDSRELNNGCVIPFDTSYKNPVSIVIGRSLVYLLLYILLAIYMYAYVTHLFGLPHLGHYVVFLQFIVPFLLACIFLAMILSSLIYRREDCIMLFVFLSVPMLFLSGISWPSSSFPTFWTLVSYLFPSTFGMNAYTKIMGMGCSLHDVRNEMTGLWLQTGIYFVLACLFYSRHIKRMISRIKPAEKE